MEEDSDPNERGSEQVPAPRAGRPRARIALGELWILVQYILTYGIQVPTPGCPRAPHQGLAQGRPQINQTCRNFEAPVIQIWCRLQIAWPNHPDLSLGPRQRMKSKVFTRDVS